MAIKVRFDLANNPLPTRLILATRGGNKIRELPIDDAVFHSTLMSGSEFSFNVHKNRCVGRDGKVDESFWRKITDFKLAYCPDYDCWYEIYVNVNESNEILKSCTALSLGEAELSQVNLYGIEVNTEEDIMREDFQPTVFWDPDHKDRSLLDRMLYKAPHWSIKHIDESLRKIQRSFKFDGKSLYDCFMEVAKEVNCVFFFDAVKSDDGKIDRSISVYDLENSCLAQNCGNRGDFITACDKCGSTNIMRGYGEDTSIFVSRKNLADEITFTTDTDAVKNCFRLEGGDDLMTATIMNCNPNGSQYLWYITDEMKADMSQALHDRLDAYDALYAQYQHEHTYNVPTALRNSYNTIVRRYQSFDATLEEIPATITGFPALMTAYYDTIDMQLFLNSKLMPTVYTASTTAAVEAAKLTTTSLNPCAVENLNACTAETAASAVLGLAKCLVRSSFQIKVKDGSYNANTHVWTGSFTVTNYGDEEDTADSATVRIQINNDMEKYTKQRIDRMLKQQSDDATDISALFKLGLTDFTNELKKYSMQRLISFRDAGQAALDMMIQQGLADRQHWISEQNNLYENMYLPHRNKCSAIEQEILVRAQELAVVVGVYDEGGGLISDGMQSVILAERTSVQRSLNFEAFVGEELWEEFAGFRREDSFSNPNYVSDGLDNEELFTRAEEFLNLAMKEIYRSATMQHSISAKLSNLLSIREFQPLVDRFEVGNWIRVEVDGTIYRLRLTEYTIDYGSWELSTVTFSDLKEGYNSASDMESLMSAIRSMSSSYGTVARQAEAGKKVKERVDSWVADGLKLTSKIASGAEHQEFIMDESGLTGRELIPETGGYKDEQVKLISSGLYITDDGWLTAKTGVGRFEFYNPATEQVEEAYGVIADTIVGNIILGQNVGIYNNSNSITLDQDGFTLITETGQNAKVFRLLRKEPNGVLTNILSIDANGSLLLNGYSTTGQMNSAIEASASGLRTEFDETLTGYATTTEMNSAISQSASEIRTEVSRTYVTATQAALEYMDREHAVADVDVEYALGDSDSVAPTTGWSTSSPVWQLGKYVWQRTKTVNGNGNSVYSEPACIQGASATVYRMSVSAPVVVMKADGSYSPSSITVSATRQYGTSVRTAYEGRFVIETSAGGNTWTAAYTSASNESSHTFTIPAAIAAIRCSLYAAGGTSTLLDQQTIAVASDGVTGGDAYTVILTNQNHTFVGDEHAAIAANTDCEIIAYKGTAKAVATIGTITGAPTGMTVTVTNSNNTTTRSKFNVAVTTSMTTKNGTLNVPVTVDGVTFNMAFTYSLALKGESGQNSTLYKMTVSNAAVGKSEGGTYNPSAITLTAQSQSGSEAMVAYAGRFKIETTADGTAWTESAVSTKDESSKSFTIPAAITAIRCSLYAAGGTVTLLDQQTVPIVFDGTSGDDAYTVVLTNENHTFAGGTSAALASNTDCGVEAYKGTERVSATIGTITGRPTGMTTTVSNNGTTSAKFNVAVTTNMTTTNGVLNVPVTVDGVTFNKVFTYSLAIKGVDGDSATAYKLIVDQAAVVRKTNGTYSPTSINLTGKSQTGDDAYSNYAGRFMIETTANGSTWTVGYTSAADEATTAFTIPASITAIRCSLYQAGGTTTLLDQQIVPIVTDGTDGKDAYTLVLTNENHTFAGSESAALADNVDCEVIAYKGAAKSVATIGVVTGMPVGMTVTVTNSSNTTTNSKFNVAVSPSMVTPNGTLNIPVTVDGKSFEMKFTYSVAFKGVPGQSTTLYKMTVSHAAVGKSAGGNYNPAEITLTAQSQSGASAMEAYAGRFKIETTADGTAWTEAAVSASDESSKGFTIPASITAIRCSLYLAGGTTTLLDQQTIPIVFDGASGGDAYTVVLTNENHTFAGDTSAALAANTDCGVEAYKGTERVAATIGTITGQPTGMTTTVSNNGTTNAKFNVAVTTSMTTTNGVLSVPVTVDGVTFNKVFTYSLALIGSDGVGVTKIEEEYYLSTSNVTQTGGSWSTTQPAWESGKYLWTRSKVYWTVGNPTTTDPVLAQAINSANQTASDVQQNLTQNYSTTTQTDTMIQNTVSSYQKIVDTRAENLIPCPYGSWTRLSSNGLTFTLNTDGSINVTGTATANIGLTLVGSSKQMKLQAGTYTLSMGSGAEGAIIQFRYYDTSVDPAVWVTVKSAAASPASFVFEHPDEIIGLRLYFYEGYTFAFTAYPQLEYGGTPHEWQSNMISNASKIQQTATEIRSEVSSVEQTVLTSGGINLIPYPYTGGGWTVGTTYTANGVTFTVNADGSIKVNGTATAGTTIHIIHYNQNYKLPPGTYTLAGNANKTGLSIRPYKRPEGATANTAVLDWYEASLAGGATFEWTTATDLFGIHLTVPSGTTASNITVKPMLEVGSVAHAWVSSLNSTATSIRQAQSSITQNATSIAQKVSIGNVAAQLTVECTTNGSSVNLGANKVTINSDNFKLAGSGNVTSSGKFTTTGTIKQSTFPVLSGDMPDKSVLDAGGLDLYLGAAGAASAGTRIAQYGPAIPPGNNGTVSAASKIGCGMKLGSGAFLTMDAGSNYVRVYKSDTHPVQITGEVLFPAKQGITWTTTNGSPFLTTTVSSGAANTIYAGPNFSVNGSLQVSGYKTRIVDTPDYGRCTLNAMESAYCVFADLGSGYIDNTGICYVMIDPVFAQTVNLKHDYQVFVTQTSAGEISWTEKQHDCFIVHGTAGTTFDWILYARQSGFTEDRMINYECDFDTPLDRVMQHESFINPDDNTSADESIMYMDYLETDYDSLSEQYMDEYEREIDDL